MRQARTALWCAVQLCEPDCKESSVQLLTSIANLLIQQKIAPVNNWIANESNCFPVSNPVMNSSLNNFTLSKTDLIRNLETNTPQNNVCGISKNIVYFPGSTTNSKIIFPNAVNPISQRCVFQPTLYTPDKLGTPEQIRAMLANQIYNQQQQQHQQQLLLLQLSNNNNNNLNPTQTTYILPNTVIPNTLLSNASNNSQLQGVLPNVF